MIFRVTMMNTYLIRAFASMQFSVVVAAAAIGAVTSLRLQNVNLNAMGWVSIFI